MIIYRVRLFVFFKKPGNAAWLLFFLLFQTASIAAQEDEPPKWALSGYVKDLQSAFVVDNPLPVPIIGNEKLVIADNFLHNRLNFKWFPASGWTLYADFRNRFFWGDQPRLDAKSFASGLDAANDYFDLSLEGADAMGLAAQTMLDRFYLEFSKGKWEIRLGRQRVNWGIATAWNPNDIFNAFAFTDFDYEERPGSDALRLRYFTGIASSLEIAVQAADSLKAANIAGLWKFGLGKYDVQLLTGLSKNNWVLGGGWAGNLKGAGFKGEWSWFRELEGAKENSFAATFNVDYQFSNSFYINGGFLYNSEGRREGSLADLFSFELSAKNLYPYRFAIFAQGLYPVTPLLNAGAAVIYSPVKAQAIFFNPTVTYSPAQNWDIDLIGQIALNQDETFNSPVQAVFLRLKRSF